MDDLLLLRLRDCAHSTRVGMIDQGFPAYLAKLAALGYAEQVGEGYRVTDAGFAYLNTDEIKIKLRTL